MGLMAGQMSLPKAARQCDNWLPGRSLYGLLMLLPQSAAFKTLHARLHSVPTLALLQLEVSPDSGTPKGQNGSPVAVEGRSRFHQHVDFAALLNVFRRRQARAPALLAAFSHAFSQL